MIRNKLYKSLSIYLDIPIAKTHIGMFDKKLCEKVIEFVRELKNLDARAS